MLEKLLLYIRSCIYTNVQKMHVYLQKLVEGFLATLQLIQDVDQGVSDASP